MDIKYIEAHDLIVKARDALRNGDKPSAWKFGERAAFIAPEMEDAWLILAASDPDPNEALAYAQKALEINPSSKRAHRAVEWTMGQIKQAPVQYDPSLIPVTYESDPHPKAKQSNRKFIYGASFIGLLVCAVVAFAAYSAVKHPAFASILPNSPAPTQEAHWAAFEIAKPTITPIDASAFAQVESPTNTPLPRPTSTERPPTSTPTEAFTSTPTEIPTEAATATPEFTETPGVMSMEIVEDTPTSEYVVPTSSAPLPDVARKSGVRWIDVDLTNQAVYAYEGDVMVNSFIVSTGTWLTPTVTGQYKIYVKYKAANMSGPGYYLPNVPYVMYFYKGYGLHGTYWHNNFGTPMSHGCVNLRTDDAGWLFNWASIGTVVNVHY